MNFKRFSRFIAYFTLIASLMLAPIGAGADVLQPADISALNTLGASEGCDALKAKVDMSAPTVWKRVSVKEGGFSVELPFSDKWTIDGKTLTPYAEEDGRYFFGKYGVQDDCTLLRQFYIKWEAQRKTNLVAKQNTHPENPPIQFTLGGRTALLFQSSDFCADDVLVIQFKKKTVYFEAPCGSFSRDLFRVAASMK